jgi:hypothetical protein
VDPGVEGGLSRALTVAKLLNPKVYIWFTTLSDKRLCKNLPSATHSECYCVDIL